MKRFESTMVAIEKRLTPLPGDLENIASELKNIDHTLNKKNGSLFSNCRKH